MGQKAGNFYRIKSREKGMEGIRISEWLGLNIWAYFSYHRNRAITRVAWRSRVGYLHGLTSGPMEHLQEHETESFVLLMWFPRLGSDGLPSKC